MVELVSFFNTGLTMFDGKTLRIVDSDIRQKTYLSLLQEGIKQARQRGYDSVLIGEYFIVEIVDLGKLKDRSELSLFFKSKHKSVKETWLKNKDFVFPAFLSEKMEYSKNYAPFSIYPLMLPPVRIS